MNNDANLELKIEKVGDALILLKKKVSDNVKFKSSIRKHSPFFN